MRVKVHFEGELARALVWEAGRQELDVRDLVGRMLHEACGRLLGAWRSAHRGVEMFPERSVSRTTRSCEAVLEKAYGPERRPPREAFAAEP